VKKHFLIFAQKKDMRKLYILAFFVMFSSQISNAQGPQTISYQAVIRDNGGAIISNQDINLRLKIHNLTASGTVIYQELHSAATNQFGLININIGEGSASIGSFAEINWGVGSKFLEIQVDPDGGSSYTSMGTTQLLNVPYSLHANEAAGLVTMTGEQRDALADPYLGMQIFNTDSRKINYYDGYGWIEIHGVRQASFDCGNPMLDARDGTYYNTVEIGGNCWMAENLNHGTMINGIEDQSDNGEVEKYCFQNNTFLCDNTYGALYQWREMMQYTETEGARGICPENWHIPTDADWNSLINATGGAANAGDNLIEGGSSGFEALWGGHRNLVTPYPFGYVGQGAFFWSSTEVNGSLAWDRSILKNNSEVFSNQREKNYGFSVRCVMD
jgi:uncharacterized protein (TIGR02145 family)